MRDKIVDNVIVQFAKRSQIGIAKYGTTLEENNNDDFLQHLKEELMDAVLYIEKLQSLKKVSKLNDSCNDYDDRVNYMKNNDKNLR
jgi:uncharacterized radical SAM superfamily protein